MSSPQQLAQMGETYLEDAVLEVLLAAANNNEPCIGAAEISRRAGIFRESGGGGNNIGNMNDSITSGILIKLCNVGRVERGNQSNNKGGWKLTAAELQKKQQASSTAP